MVCFNGKLKKELSITEFLGGPKKNWIAEFFDGLGILIIFEKKTQAINFYLMLNIKKMAENNTTISE